MFRRGAAFFERENRAVGADGEADAFCRGAAEKFDEAIVAAAAADGILRAEPFGDHFESGAHVVIEAADEAPVFFVLDAAQIQLVFQLGEVRAAIVAKMIGDARQRFDDGLLGRNFGIEDAQRIRFDAALGIGAEFVFHFLQFGAQQLDVLRAAVLVADGIDEERGAREADAIEENEQHFDELRRRSRVRRTGRELLRRFGRTGGSVLFADARGETLGRCSRALCCRGAPACCVRCRRGRRRRWLRGEG